MAKKDIEAHKFPKGTSGNPNGRPKGTKNRSTIIRKWLEAEQNVKNPITGKFEDLSQEDIITLAAIKKAREGDISAFKTLMEFGYPLNIENSSGNLTINIIEPE